MSNPTPLQHLAIIPDGNRRWAKKNRLRSAKSMYEKGGDRINEAMETAFSCDIKYLTVWTTSRSNLTNRSREFLAAIEGTYQSYLDKLIRSPKVKDLGIHVEIVGEWDGLLSDSITDKIKTLEAVTEKNNSFFLTLLIGYDGKRERGSALQAFSAQKTPEHTTDVLEYDNVLRDLSWTGHLPEVDLIVRTGSWDDPHNSAGFLSLLTGDSQYAYPKVLWPEFSGDMLREVISDYKERERRKGA